MPIPILSLVLILVVLLGLVLKLLGKGDTVLAVALSIAACVSLAGY